MEIEEIEEALVAVPELNSWGESTGGWEELTGCEVFTGCELLTGLRRALRRIETGALVQVGAAMGSKLPSSRSEPC